MDCFGFIFSRLRGLDRSVCFYGGLGFLLEGLVTG